MLDVDEIENTIKDLENGDTTFDTCIKLASLYIVLDKYKQSERAEDEVELELNDILPQYKKYCEIKRAYQLKITSKDAVLDSMRIVCTEIKEFIENLYSHTDTQEERELITELIMQLIENKQA